MIPCSAVELPSVLAAARLQRFQAWLAHPASRSSVVIGRRAAAIAGGNPPRTAVPTASKTPRHSTRGVVRKVKDSALKVTKVLVLAAMVPSIAMVPARNALSRRHERRADRFALDLTGSPSAFTVAMRRLASQNLAEAHPSRLTRWLFCSHPPVESRLDMARNWNGEARQAGKQAS